MNARHNPHIGPEMLALLGRIGLRDEQQGEDEDNRLWQAMMLAADLETCRALLRGETVPVEELNPEWVRRLGRKR